MNDDQTSPPAEPAGALNQGQTNAPHRILVVDDDGDMRRLSAEVLTGFGYQVDVAEDGAAGWVALHAKNYDLLITDNNMPNMTGIELVQKLRSARMALPVIMASGTLPEEELNGHSWLQLAATLLKPFSGEELLGKVKKALGAVKGAGGQTSSSPN